MNPLNPPTGGFLSAPKPGFMCIDAQWMCMWKKKGPPFFLADFQGIGPSPKNRGKKKNRVPPFHSSSHEPPLAQAPRRRGTPSPPWAPGPGRSPGTPAPRRRGRGGSAAARGPRRTGPRRGRGLGAPRRQIPTFAETDRFSRVNDTHVQWR